MNISKAIHVSVRRAKPSDLESVYLLINQLEELEFVRNAFDPVFLKNVANKNILYLVAEFDGRIVGFMSIHTHWLLHHADRVAEIMELVVDSSVRSQNIGKRLLDEGVTWAQTLGCELIEVTSNQKRTRAHAFYESHGFSRTHLKLVLPFRKMNTNPLTDPLFQN